MAMQFTWVCLRCFVYIYVFGTHNKTGIVSSTTTFTHPVLPSTAEASSSADFIHSWIRLMENFASSHCTWPKLWRQENDNNKNTINMQWKWIARQSKYEFIWETHCSKWCLVYTNSVHTGYFPHNIVIASTIGIDFSLPLCAHAREMWKIFLYYFLYVPSDIFDMSMCPVPVRWYFKRVDYIFLQKIQRISHAIFYALIWRETRVHISYFAVHSIRNNVRWLLKSKKIYKYVICYGE